MTLTTPISLHRYYKLLARTLFLHCPIVVLYQAVGAIGRELTPREHWKKKDRVMIRHLRKPMSHPDRQKFNTDSLTQKLGYV